MENLEKEKLRKLRTFIRQYETGGVPVRLYKRAQDFSFKILLDAGIYGL